MISGWCRRGAQHRRSGWFGRGGIRRSRPLVTGDSVAASHRARPLPICSVGRITARSRRGVGGRTGDLGPCRPGPTPEEPPLGSAIVKIAQGRGTRRDTEGEPEPGNGRRGQTGERRRRETRGRRAKGENPAGKRETGGKPAGETGGREGEAPDHPVRIRGSGAARIYDAAGGVPGARPTPSAVC